jgi:hypothetical protein
MISRAATLKALRSNNKKISRADRALLWGDVSEFMPKQTFYKIVTGSFCSEANTDYAKAFLKRMKGFIEAQKKRVNNINKKGAKN